MYVPLLVQLDKRAQADEMAELYVSRTPAVAVQAAETQEARSFSLDRSQKAVGVGVAEAQ